jgi:CheY-like chemotaxis protein
VIGSVLEASRPLVEKWGHQLTVALPAEALFVEGDVLRLGQVVLNLLDNACKYTPRGGRLSLVVERAGEQAVVRVRDSGIGIPAEMLDSIFDMFTQVDRAVERAQGGLGIGLTLVRRLVELHGGAVEAHSDGPGQGSEMVIRLPLAPRPAACEEEAREERPLLRRRRVLVVDDNRDAADSLAVLLEVAGQEVVVAYDGLAALDLAASFRPDVLLLDLGLPNLSGYEVASRLRQREGEEKPMLVALTGWGQEEDRRRSREAGFDLHLTKPVDFHALRDVLASL